ncbi:hypothetical protein DAEQUDRAFT_770243 [Daedalea quercina L-15889]|uniref:Oxidase ustYa n=1 Tax=Daedalea quercina L-15889 TaxID=1314783 RepID=A0A165L0Q0_9APHY|nr:hypothetical protein DAEQUDRAFT_770243 [Daedalea quercina L-15889]
MLSNLKRHSPQSFRPAVWVLLLISCIFNVLSVKHYRRGPVLDDSRYSYVDDDYPNELPLRLDTIEMDFEDTSVDGAYSQTGFDAWLEWHALDHFPRAHGFVKLGPDGRDFGVSMFHQIHCLSMIREAMVNGANDHAAHCLNFMRQAILCNADTTLEVTTETTHTCKDFTQVYDYIAENQRHWPKKSKAPSLNQTEDGHHGHDLR